MLGAAGLVGGLGVVAGAFGAHALEARLDADSLDAFTVGVRYQMYHAIAILALVSMPNLSWSSRWVRFAAWSWLLGIALFSGSLYGLSILEWKWLWPATPLGGLALIAGWVSVLGAAIAAAKDQS